MAKTLPFSVVLQKPILNRKGGRTVSPEEKEDGVEESGEKKKSPMVMILVIAIAAVLLIGGVIIAAFVMSSKVKDEAIKGGKADKTVEAEQVKEPLLSWEMTKEPVSYNLKSEKGKRRGSILFAKVVLAFTNDNSGATEELDKRAARIRDIFITYLGARTAKNMDVENIPTIKEELLAKINPIMENKIEDIYFEHYFIQK